jgi:hypothetical protein
MCWRKVGHREDNLENRCPVSVALAIGFAANEFGHVLRFVFS